MDSIDKKILLDLMINCRITYQELATKNGISANAIKKRVNKLLSQGIIEFFNIELSLAQVDAEFLLSLITTDGTEEEEEFIDSLAKGLYSKVSYIGPASGGIYILFASYPNGTQGLSEIGSFLRNFPAVKEVEVHPLIQDLGKKIEFSKMELKVLKYLVEDPRMAVSDISKNSGLTARMVNKIINKLIKSDVIRFNLHWNLNAGDSIAFMVRLEWNEKLADLNTIISTLMSQFPNEYLLPIISATSPIVFAMFLVNTLQSISQITQDIRKMPFVSSVVTIIGKPSRSFPDIKKLRLNELIVEAGV